MWWLKEFALELNQTSDVYIRFLKLQWNGSLHIFPRSTHLLTHWYVWIRLAYPICVSRVLGLFIFEMEVLQRLTFYRSPMQKFWQQCHFFIDFIRTFCILFESGWEGEGGNNVAVKRAQWERDFPMMNCVLCEMRNS